MSTLALSLVANLTANTQELVLVIEVTIQKLVELE